MRRENVLKWVLVASLALNLFMVGGWVVHRAGVWMNPAGRYAAMHDGHGGRGFDRDAGRSALSDADRARVDAIWAENRPVLRAGLDQMREARQAVHAALTAEPFDAQALTRAQDDLAAAQTAAHTAVSRQIAAVAQVLTGDARRAYFQAAMPRHGFGGGPGGPGPHHGN